jgi:hypothetical protein
MNRINIPSVGTFDRVYYPSLPGSSDRVEYRRVAAESGHGRVQQSVRVGAAAIFAAGVLLGIPLGWFVG